MNIKGHFETITRHKLLVMKYCFACGLYEQGLAHDLSKYSPTEFIPGCIYYQGDHSPNEAEREARGRQSDLSGRQVHRCRRLELLRAQQGPLPAPPGDPGPAGKAAQDGAGHRTGADLCVHEVPAGVRKGLLNARFRKLKKFHKNLCTLPIDRDGVHRYP